MKLEEKVLNFIEPKITKEEFDVEYVEFVKEGNSNILRVVIDKINSSVSIDDCEKVSRIIEDDVDKVIDKEYVLEVSSPGLERQLKSLKLYKKYVGQNIHVRLYKKSDIGKEFEGMLENVNEEEMTVCVNVNGNKVNVELDKIASAHTVYDFAQDLKINKKENVNINELKRF